MKVMLINHFPLAGSGSGTYVRNAAALLTEKGHEVCIIMPENTMHYSAPEGVRVYPVFFTNAESTERIDGALPFNFPCFTSHPRSSVTFFDLSDKQIELYLSAFESAIQKAIDEFHPDILHAQHIWLLAWLAMKTGLPYLITSHGTDLMGYHRSGRFREYADLAVAGAKYIITISNDNDLLVREYFPQCSDKIIFIRNGYDPSRFFPENLTKEQVLDEYDIMPLKYLVLFSGKLAHFKGVDVLLEAARLYEGEHPGQILTLIAGDGELSLQLKKQAEAYRLQHIHFLGFVPVSQLRRLYSVADVTVVPSRREPFGLVAVEALACGSPVVATNQGGLPDIISDRVGALVDVGDSFALSAAIQSEMLCKDRAEKGRYAARYALDKYSLRGLINDLIEIYEMLLEK